MNLYIMTDRNLWNRRTMFWRSRGAAALLALLCTAAGSHAAKSPGAGKEGGTVRVAPMATVRERPGITGAGWGAAYDVEEGAQRRRKVVAIYPNHPDDWGKTAGTGLSYSWDDGKTWTAGPDNSPIEHMVDLWQDQLADGTLVALGIRDLPDPKKPEPPGADGFFTHRYALGLSRDGGTTWSRETATVRSAAGIGPIARPLPRIFIGRDGAWLMPAYSWGPGGARAVLLKSKDRGRNWDVAATMATAAAFRALGVAVTTPWFENMVVRTADGSLLTVVRTASNARGVLMTTRSTDEGATWSAPERLLAGPERRIVAGKLPNVALLPNGALVLLTAHTKNHCRIHVSWDGRGREWSEAYVITSQSGGNTSLVPLGRDQVLVLTPASGRISAWTVTIRPEAPAGGAEGARTAAPAAPTDVRATATGTGATLAWNDGRGRNGGNESAGIRYLVTPVLLKAAEAEMEVERYAPIETEAGATSLALAKNLAPGGAYRFEVVAIDAAGRRSAATTTGEVTLGNRTKPEVNE